MARLLHHIVMVKNVTILLNPYHRHYFAEDLLIFSGVKFTKVLRRFIRMTIPENKIR